MEDKHICAQQPEAEEQGGAHTPRAMICADQTGQKVAEPGKPSARRAAGRQQQLWESQDTVPVQTGASGTESSVKSAAFLKIDAVI